jgi:hypothetical protein
VVRIDLAKGDGRPSPHFCHHAVPIGLEGATDVRHPPNGSFGEATGEGKRYKRDIKDEEVALNWNHLIRQSHRWISAIFMGFVILNFMVLGQEQVALVVGFLTLIPLFLLMITGVYLFALPYTVRWSRARSVAS